MKVRFTSLPIENLLFDEFGISSFSDAGMAGMSSFFPSFFAKKKELDGTYLGCCCSKQKSTRYSRYLPTSLIQQLLVCVSD